MSACLGPKGCGWALEWCGICGDVLESRLVDMDVPLRLELLVDFPLRVISDVADFDEAAEVELFGAELDACHSRAVRCGASCG